MYLSRLMRVWIGLMMLSAYTVLSPGFLASYGYRDLHFVRYRPLLPIGWRIVQIVRQRRRKMANTAPTTLCAIQAASYSTLFKAQLYSICD